MSGRGARGKPRLDLVLLPAHDMTMSISPKLALALTGLSLTLSGCAITAAADLITAPVRVGSKAVDVASTVVDATTTSQSETDQKRGREIRRREERLGKLQREYNEEREDCLDGKRKACLEAQAIRAEMEELTPQLPLEPR